MHGEPRGPSVPPSSDRRELAAREAVETWRLAMIHVPGETLVEAMRRRAVLVALCVDDDAARAGLLAELGGALTRVSSTFPDSDDALRAELRCRPRALDPGQARRELREALARRRQRARRRAV